MGTCSSTTYRRSVSGTALDPLQLAWQGAFAASASSNSLGDLHRTTTFAMTYPMYVVALEVFMKMTEVRPHEELLEKGVVIQYNQSMGDVIFVSHQWTSYTHPDPHFHQLRVLQQALTNLLTKMTTVHPQFMNFVPVGSRQRLTAEELLERKLFLWYDFFACPQLEARSDSQDIKPSLQNAVDSIPSYVQMSRFFFVLAPVMEHAENGKMLSKHSWRSRGWCRTERVARELTCTDSRMVVVESAEHQYLMVPFDSWLRPAGEGQFTVASDRERVVELLRSMVQRKLDSLLRRKDIHGYRLLLNMQHVHLQMRIGECRKCSPSPSSDKEAEDLVASFLEENRFKTVTDREHGWTPACFAALRGDLPLLKAILQQGANVNERMKSKELQFHAEPGMSLLHLAAQFGNNEALQLLIQEKAELNSQDQLGMSPLHRATLGDNAVGVQLLLQAGSDPACREKIAKFTAMGPAAAWGSLRGIHAIMEHSPLREFRWCLHVAVLGEGSSVEMVTTLIAAGAALDETLDLNLPTCPSPKRWKLFQAVLKQAYGPSMSFMIANAVGATPLTCSLLVGSFEATAALLAAQADVDQRNACGASPIEIARAVGAPDFVMKGLRGDLEDCIQMVSASDAQQLFLCV
ncbi:unnamed protein product [Symbiodinium sp. CCMP2592]|nr:unnamed protein product [Symbiodinium sp. CCMP2592]